MIRKDSHAGQPNLDLVLFPQIGPGQHVTLPQTPLYHTGMQNTSFIEGRENSGLLHKA